MKMYILTTNKASVVGSHVLCVVRLDDREVQLLYDTEQRKMEVQVALAARQKLGNELKLRSARVTAMGELELAELRADIKHFIGDRKCDEELANCSKFECDSSALLGDIKMFGSGK